MQATIVQPPPPIARPVIGSGFIPLAATTSAKNYPWGTPPGVDQQLPPRFGPVGSVPVWEMCKTHNCDVSVNHNGHREQMEARPNANGGDTDVVFSPRSRPASPTAGKPPPPLPPHPSDSLLDNPADDEYERDAAAHADIITIDESDAIYQAFEWVNESPDRERPRRRMNPLGSQANPLIFYKRPFKNVCIGIGPCYFHLVDSILDNSIYDGDESKVTIKGVKLTRGNHFASLTNVAAFGTDENPLIFEKVVFGDMHMDVGEARAIFDECVFRRCTLEGKYTMVNCTITEDGSAYPSPKVYKFKVECGEQVGMEKQYVFGHVVAELAEPYEEGDLAVNLKRVSTVRTTLDKAAGSVRKSAKSLADKLKKWFD